MNWGEHSKDRLSGRRPYHGSALGNPSRAYWSWRGNHQSKITREMRLDSEGVEIFLNLSGALDLLTIGVAISDGHSRPLFLNRYIQEILAGKDGLFIGADGFRTASSPETGALRRLIADAASAQGSSRSCDREIVLSRPSGRRPLLGLVMPSRLTNRSIEEGDSVVYFLVSDPEWRIQISNKSIRQLFGLTPTEGRIGALLASGSRLDEAAAALGIAVTTARNHLKHIFYKTGTSRQSELMHLLECLLGRIQRD